MCKNLTIRQLRDLICDEHGELEYVDALLERLEAKESKDIYRKSVRLAQNLVNALIEANQKVIDLDDLVACDQSSCQTHESVDISASVSTTLDRYPEVRQNLESA